MHVRQSSRHFPSSCFVSSISFRHFAAYSGLSSRRAGIEIDEAAHGLGEAGLGSGWDRSGAGLHPGIAFDEKRRGAPGFICPAARLLALDSVFLDASPFLPPSADKCLSRLRLKPNLTQL
jgi:hypothetical protein